MNIQDYLSTQSYDLIDSWSGKPVGIYRHLNNIPTELFNEYRHKMICLNMGQWVYLEKVVTREECIELYGPITEEVFGTRGGWKSVTFGSTKFISKYLKPLSN